MSAKRHERTYARRCAMQIVYQCEILGKPSSFVIDGGYFIDDEMVVSDYAKHLATGVEEHLTELDSYLKTTSENWSLERMPAVDRSILRMAVYEMIHVDKVPISVAINEAVELAKDFGGEDDSPRFVNGVLGRIAKVIEEERHDA